MAFASACRQPTDEEFFNDVERRAGPVSPSSNSHVSRPPLASSSRLRPRIPAGASQQRPAAGDSVDSQRAAVESLRLRDLEARGQGGRTQQGAPAAAGGAEGVAGTGGVRRRHNRATGRSRGRLLGTEGRIDAALTPSEAAGHPGLTARIVLGFIRSYQRAISPVLGDVCRYSPSCSHYAYEAIERHGLLKGAWLGFRRLLRCRPFGGSGFDPVPR
jgi:uncharacterized protein